MSDDPLKQEFIARMVRKPTLKDVALAAGVSEMTASRALRGTPDVSQKTRAKISSICARLGYVPNRIAGALASQSANLVGVIVPSLSSFVFPEVLSGISAALGQSDLQPVIGISRYDPDEEEKVIREMLAWRPAGLIVAGLEHSDTARAMLRGANIPLIEIMDVDGEPVDCCVGISHTKAGALMAREIIRRGYRNIGFIGTKMTHDFRAQKRLRGFCGALEQAGLALCDRSLYSGASTVKKGREMTRDILARSPRIECIYYSSDVMSVGGLMHCLSESIAVPRDLALAGFNRLDILDGLPIELATTDSHRFEIGKTAAELILAKSRGGTPSHADRVEFAPIASPGMSL